MEKTIRKKNLNGIRGWLLVFQIMLWLLLMLYTLSTIGAMTFTGVERAGILVTSIPAGVILIFVLLMMTRRNIRFRLGYVAFVIFSFLSVGILALFGQPPKSASDFPFGTALWLIYLYRSKRVRVTFGLEKAPEAEPAASEEAVSDGGNAPDAAGDACALKEGESLSDAPTAELTYFYLPHCPHCKLATGCIEKLRESDEKYRRVEIRMIDESAEKALADTYDYYYVPAFFIGHDKLYEGHAEMENVQTVLDEAQQRASSGEQGAV